MGLNSLEAVDATVVEVVTEGGLVGYGETCPLGPLYQPQHALGARAALAEFAPHLLGQDAGLVRGLVTVMDEVLTGHSYAKAAIEIAGWDLLGKACGMRGCDLLGGAGRERGPAYVALSLASPNETGRMAEQRQDEGYTHLQLKAGGRSAEEDVAAIRSVASVLRPGSRLVVDANRSWTTGHAITVSRLCE